MSRILPRLLAGSVAAFAALAGTMSPAAAAAPSAAAASAVTVKPHLGDVNVAADGDGKAAAVLGWIDPPAGASATRPVTVGRVRVSIDTAGVSGFAVVAPEKDSGLGPGYSCRTAGTVVSCTSVGPFTLDDEPDLIPLAALHVTARPGVEAGRTGRLVITAQADDGPVGSSTSTVRVAEGVDLAAGEPSSVTVQPGTRPAVDLRVGNAGGRPVDGAVLLMIGWPDKLLDGPGAGNCRYGEILLCTFTEVLAPGRTYTLSDPVRLRIPADAATGSSSLAFGQWFTPAEWQELLDIAPPGGQLLGRPGTGRPTRLRANVARSGLPQVDTDPANNAVITEIVVGGRRPTDVAAIGATVRGAAGDHVKARLGFATTGQGTLYPELFDNADPGTHVIVPPEVQAVKVDERCAALLAGDPDDGPIIEPDTELGVPGATEYVCMTLTGSIPPSRRTLFDFTFQVRGNPSEARPDPLGNAGEVTVNDEELLALGGIDRNARNDRAAIDVTVTGTGSGGPGSGGEGSGGEGGGLAVTGVDATAVAAVGALLVLAGGAAWLLVRRRRIRFTA